MMLNIVLPLLLSLLLTSAAAVQQWTFVQNGTSGIVAIEAIVVSPTLVLMYDRADGNPLLLPNGARAWAALWDLEKNVATPLETLTNTFCAGGGFISNGTLVAVAGQPREDPYQPPADGRMGIRLFDPCTSPGGVNCTVFEDPANVHLAELRWYPTGLRIPDGSLMVIGGSHSNTFYNTDAANSIEFFPGRAGEAGTVRPSKFLLDAEPVNMFPRSFVLPSGNVFIVANNLTMIYNIATGTETRLPDIPNGVHVTNPFDGTAQLLPLSPPLYEPSVLVCGGSATDPRIPEANLSTQDPASDQCSRITLTPLGVARGWEVERMPETRVLLESVLLPTGDLLLINGAQTGYGGYPSIRGTNATGMSNSDHPARRALLYKTDAPRGARISHEGLPESDIARMYHSSAVLTPQGNIMVAGSNPHATVVPASESQFPTEFRVEYLNPEFITANAPRPAIISAPAQILFNQRATLRVNIPADLHGAPTKVSLMDLGFATHSFHANSRLVFLEHTLRGSGSDTMLELEITAPPNNNVYPPGPAFVFLVGGEVYSQAVKVMVGDGGNPPRPDQGVRMPVSSV
ncbi:hypothetical protein D9615_003138 [Tricholomella constricta]|uniref:Glyoxal oxidase n=1 Tax=Tricholomella constricta TaxID=117010 RepID=A0A8H5HJA7_9AGAR|nr:hypothetical protein D9615_003138 [Tricholomella constricta]